MQEVSNLAVAEGEEFPVFEQKEGRPALFPKPGKRQEESMTTTRQGISEGNVVSVESCTLPVVEISSGEIDSFELSPEELVNLKNRIEVLMIILRGLKGRELINNISILMKLINKLPESLQEVYLEKIPEEIQQKIEFLFEAMDIYMAVQLSKQTYERSGLPKDQAKLKKLNERYARLPQEFREQVEREFKFGD